MPGVVSSIASIVVNGESKKIAQAYIIPLDEETDEPVLEEEFALQYFPETVNDHKATEWVQKIIRGLSHPLHDFVSGGDRKISFQVIFTRDMPDDLDESRVDAAERRKNDGVDAYNVDVAAASHLIRSFLYPIYPSASISLPPRRLLLVLPGYELNYGGRFGGAASDNSADALPCFCTQADKIYEEAFEDGTPRILVMQCEFTETIQYQGAIRPVSGDDVFDATPGIGNLARYTIRPIRS
jgi:hypothetical protein